jgi:hypothetical protein
MRLRGRFHRCECNPVFRAAIGLPQARVWQFSYCVLRSLRRDRDGRLRTAASIVPISQFREYRSFVYPQQLTQICFNACFQVVECEHLGLQRAAGKRAQQHVIVRRTVSKLARAERAGEQRALFDKRHHESKTIQRMFDRGPRISEVDRCGGGVLIG